MIGPVVSGSGTGDEQDAAIRRVAKAIRERLEAMERTNGSDRKWLIGYDFAARVLAAAVSGQAGPGTEPNEPSCAVCGAASCAGGCCSACTATGGCTHTLPAALSGRAGEPSDAQIEAAIVGWITCDGESDPADFDVTEHTRKRMRAAVRAALAVGGDRDE